MGLFFAAGAIAGMAGGCKKAVQRLPATQIHSITRELAAAAVSAIPADAKVRSDLRASDSHSERTDHVYVTLGPEGTVAERAETIARLLQSFSAVATRHSLTQDAPAQSGGLLRFVYRRDDLPTHTIHILSPIPAHFAERPAAPQNSGARLAIILDDLGSDRAAADAVFGLPYPLTLSVLPDHPHSTEIAEEAHQRGYQVMLHLPMQSVADESPEPVELRPGLPPTELAELVDRMLSEVPHAVGVNNHQGSQATADPSLMSELMPVLRQRNLFYVDSRTTAATVAYDAAQRLGESSAFRNVPFLDDVAEVSAVRSQLALAIRGALTKGAALAIGHPHPATLQALSEVLPRLESQGVHLVFASDLVH